MYIRICDFDEYYLLCKSVYDNIAYVFVYTRVWSPPRRPLPHQQYFIHDHTRLVLLLFIIVALPLLEYHLEFKRPNAPGTVAHLTVVNEVNNTGCSANCLSSTNFTITVTPTMQSP